MFNQGTTSLTAVVSFPPISHYAFALTTAGLFQDPGGRRGITVLTHSIGRCVSHEAGTPPCGTENVFGYSYTCTFLAPLTLLSVAQNLERDGSLTSE
jgi:hypothetical protein